MAEHALREVVDAVLAQGVGDPLGHQYRDHVREDVFQLARELEHDDAQRDCHSGDAGQEGCGADHGEDARGDGRDELPDQTAEEGAGVQGRDDDAGGDLGAEGDDGQDQLDRASECEPADIVPAGVGASFVFAHPRIRCFAFAVAIDQ